MKKRVLRVPRSPLSSTIILAGTALLLTACQQNPPASASSRDDAGPTFAAAAPGCATPVLPTKFDWTVPADIGDPGDAMDSASFAWREFVALTWPAKPNPSAVAGIAPYFRGQPSESAVSGGTGPDGVTVWETFYHRAELYPAYPGAEPVALPDANALPSYLYDPGGIAPRPAGVDVSLFNNLDEASEITLANMYYTPLAAKADALAKKNPQPTPAQLLDAQTRAAIVYEAKGNPTIFNYLKRTGYNNLGAGSPTPTLRTLALNQAIAKINNRFDPKKGPAFDLPTGSIEIKATWRRYDPPADDKSRFHHAQAIYYTTDTVTGLPVANNGTFLLIGLHIIQKTPKVPSFTFATFEHVSNEENGFRFMNTQNQQVTPPNFPRALPDPGVIRAIRQYPIPDCLSAFNQAVQAKLRSDFGASNVWANYELIGVQALVQDQPGGDVPPQQFYLSNFATETNDTLQFFQGGLDSETGTVPNPTAAHVFTQAIPNGPYKGHAAGGCVGCHGSQGQLPGGDFSVIAATGNTFTAQPIVPYPTGSPVADQNPCGFPLPYQSSRCPNTQPTAARKTSGR